MGRIFNVVKVSASLVSARWLSSAARRRLFSDRAAMPFGNRYVEIRKQHFVEIADRNAQKRLFALSVEMVEIEVFSYCNRKCWFCPNVDYDRRGANVIMESSLYDKVLKELSEIDYKGKIFYSRYNEPFADRMILDRLRQARTTLPKARLCTFTNGDYLTPEFLGEIYDAGLREMYVSLYLGNKVRFDDDRMEARIERFVEKMGLSGSWKIRTRGVEYHFKADYRDMELVVFGRNFNEIGYDRGGTVQLANACTRRSPCLIPFTAMYIDANGSVVPCCNIRSDIPDHRGYLVGDLHNDSIYDIYAKRLVGWRAELIRFGGKKTPCDMCLMHETKIPATEANVMLSEEIYQKFTQRG